MRCVAPMRLETHWASCGRCLHCRIRRRTLWTLRMMHHQQYVEHSSFITLTYEDKNLMVRNGISNLVRSDVQKYFKRLRINEQRNNRRLQIQYYLCGEYGDRTSRPHYHFILFGNLDVWSYPSETRGERVFAISGNPVFDAWELGSVNIANAEADSMRYVAQYIDKKLFGIASAFSHREAPFQLASQRLGIEWLNDNLEKVMYEASVSFRGNKYPIPRAYMNRIKAVFPEAADGITDRVVSASILANMDLILELAPEFGGRSWDQLNHTERSQVASLIHDRSKVLSEVTASEIKFKTRMNKL